MQLKRSVRVRTGSRLLDAVVFRPATIWGVEAERTELAEMRLGYMHNRIKPKVNMI